MKTYQVSIPKKIKHAFDILVDTKKEQKIYNVPAETSSFEFTLPDEFEYLYSRKTNSQSIFNVYYIHNEKTVQLVPLEIK
jgi:hypothetical protein